MADYFQIKREGNGLFFIDLTTGECLADGADDGTLTTIVRIMIIADTITADEIGLILNRPGSGENLPGVLTALWPVCHSDDSVILEVVRETAPYGEPQVVARQKQDTEAAVVDNRVFPTRLIIAVFSTVTEQMVLVIIGLAASTSINKIMTIMVTSYIVVTDSETAGDGTVQAFSGGAHPLERDAGILVFGDIMRLCGKASTPHFRQYIEVAVWGFSDETLSPTDVFLRIAPLDVQL